MTEVAFIGLGAMGGPMARNLARGGFSLRAYDIDPDAAAALAADGAVAASSAAEAAAGADIVITMLPNGPHVEDVLFGSGGVAEALDPKALFIDMSTIAPAVTDSICAQLAECGIAMLDAPVGRQQHNAVDGTLLIMVGGPKAAVERAMPLFEKLGDTIVHCGKTGTGARLKLVNNYMSVTLNALTAEALTLAEAAGLDPELTREVLMGTAAGKGHLGITYPAKVLKGDLTPGFAVDLAYKDLGLALDLAASLDTPVLTGSVARHFYSQARSEGHGRLDWSALYKIIRDSVMERS